MCLPALSFSYKRCSREVGSRLVFFPLPATALARSGRPIQEKSDKAAPSSRALSSSLPAPSATSLFPPPSRAWCARSQQLEGKGERKISPGLLREQTLVSNHPSIHPSSMHLPPPSRLGRRTHATQTPRLEFPPPPRPPPPPPPPPPSPSSSSLFSPKATSCPRGRARGEPWVARLQAGSCSPRPPHR